MLRNWSYKVEVLVLGRRPKVKKSGLFLQKIDFRSLGKPVDGDDVGSRIDAFLAKNYPFLGRSAWQSRLRQGQLRVQDVAVHPAYKLKKGDAVTHFNPEESEPHVDSNIFAFWEGDGVMAVYKPSNLPMHEGGKYRKKTFCELVRREIGESWSAVHRLDRDTSGLVLCANDPTIRNVLSAELRARTLEKTYLAIAMGKPTKDHWIEKRPLGFTGKTEWRDKRWVVKGGLPSETEFNVVETAGDYVLMKIKPKTGRTHQIRIHAAANGLPLIGDTRYNSDETIFLEYIDRGFTPRVLQRIGAPRLCLHASGLSFLHPVTNLRCDLNLPLPNDMTYIWDSIKKGSNFPLPRIDSGFSLEFKRNFRFVGAKGGT